MITLREFLRAFPVTQAEFSHLEIMKNGEEIGSVCGPMLNHNNVISRGTDALLNLKVIDMELFKDDESGLDDIIIRLDGNVLASYSELDYETILEADRWLKTYLLNHPMSEMSFMKSICNELIMFNKETGEGVITEL